jgi:GTPase
MFCDELKIKVAAGSGGDGAVSFRREKWVPRGGPDGGDGGNGGSITFVVNPNLNTLSHLTNGKTYNAETGISGQRKNMHGRNGEMLTIEVPKGTIIYDQEDSNLIADLNEAGDQIKIVSGGRGGMGNARFVSSTHQAPKFAEIGEPGESKEIKLELKLVADVGLIGLPSAGKSTLISVISNARPKIAAYHFTTLTPNLGVVDMKKHGSKESFVVADIPGLIEGASQGKGLGHQFLRHISRTKLLVHIIDGSLENVADDYKTIIKEIGDFDKDLVKKEGIVVINKKDLLSDEQVEKKIKELKKVAKKKEIFAISGVTNENLKPLLFAILSQLNEINSKEKDVVIEKPKKIKVLEPHKSQVKFEIEKVIKKEEHKIFRISGNRIEQLFIMTDTKNQEGVERLYHFMERLGIKAAIDKRGAQIGDTIRVKEKTIPYRK